MKEKGLIFVISAPSGAGKTTICRHLSQNRKKLKYSVSCTTRPRRAGEKNGIDYYFMTERDFKSSVKKHGFAEWACVHGHYYGTPRKALDTLLGRGIDVIMDIDVQGGLKIKRAYPEAVLVFVMAPSYRELERRLKARNKDSEQVIAKRMRNARLELKSLPRYEYLVINDKLKDAEADVASIIDAEHKRVRGAVPRF
jgi:guanylate kinase